MASKIVTLSFFNGVSSDDAKIKKAMEYLAGRADVELQKITALEYDSMGSRDKYTWSVSEPFLAWEQDGFLYRYVLKK